MTFQKIDQIMNAPSFPEPIAIAEENPAYSEQGFSPSDSELMEFIANANNPQLGSFGEAIFEQLTTRDGAIVSRLHVGRSDFSVNGQRIDVKTSRQRLQKTLTKPVFKMRKKIEGVHYAILEFHQLGCLVSLEEEVLCNLDWEFLDGVFEAWKRGDFGKAHSIKKNKRQGLCPEMTELTKRIFCDAGLPEPYILYRTVMFEKESPHNLLPTQRKLLHRKGFTVFFVFKTAPAVSENLDEIIAFPDEADSSLVRLEKLRTSSDIENLEKADIEKIPGKFRFESFEALRVALLTHQLNEPKITHIQS
jgi:hypothetical protein